MWNDYNLTDKSSVQPILELLKIKPIDMKDLEEEEKRKKFMEQQMNYMNGLAKKDKQPGIA